LRRLSEEGDSDDQQRATNTTQSLQLLRQLPLHSQALHLLRSLKAPPPKKCGTTWKQTDSESNLNIHQQVELNRPEAGVTEKDQP